MPNFPGLTSRTTRNLPAVATLAATTKVPQEFVSYRKKSLLITPPASCQEDRLPMMARPRAVFLYSTGWGRQTHAMLPSFTGKLGLLAGVGLDIFLRCCSSTALLLGKGFGVVNGKILTVRRGGCIRRKPVFLKSWWR